eukprot:1736686-Pleurochrysis_carterae.AAC.1
MHGGDFVLLHAPTKVHQGHLCAHAAAHSGTHELHVRTPATICVGQVAQRCLLCMCPVRDRLEPARYLRPLRLVPAQITQQLDMVVRIEQTEDVRKYVGVAHGSSESHPSGSADAGDVDSVGVDVVRCIGVWGRVVQ